MASVAATRVRNRGKVPELDGTNARLRFVHYTILASIAFLICCVLYGAALHAPFVFDDLGLPFGHGNAMGQPLSYWLAGVRPVLMFSYLVNWDISGLGTFSYHFLNLLIHITNTCLVFAIVYALLVLIGTHGQNRLILTAFSAGVFLVHPLQTESVAYIAGRSESLASFFGLAACTLFLYRKNRQIRWPTAAGVVLLFALAVGTKENMAVIPALLVLTDLYWNRPWKSALRGNWRLYAILTVVASFGVVWIVRNLAAAKTVGTQTTGFTPITYFLTEARVCWVYVRLFLFPMGQSLDHDFTAAKSIFELGTLLALVGWAAAIALAIVFRKKFPLASFGLFAYLVLLAPTSSFIPIADALVERRTYLPILALLLIACDFLRRMQVRSFPLLAGMATVLAALSVATIHRVALWEHPLQLWIDAVESRPLKPRTYLSLADASIEAGRCNDALPYFSPPDPRLSQDPTYLEAWGRLLGCAGKQPEALQLLQEAASEHPTASLYELVGLLDAQTGKLWDAKAALDRSVELADGSVTPDSPYESRGYWYEVMSRYPEAMADYQQALKRNKSNYTARARLLRLETQMAAASAR